MKARIYSLIICIACIGIGNYSNAQFITYSENFTASTSYCPATPQYDNWGIFRAQLDTSVFAFKSVTIKGSFDNVGRTCNDPAIVSQIAGSLRDGVIGDWACGGFNWHVGTGCISGCAIVADAIRAPLTPGGGPLVPSPTYFPILPGYAADLASHLPRPAAGTSARPERRPWPGPWDLTRRFSSCDASHRP